jgi:hypothetical protein
MSKDIYRLSSNLFYEGVTMNKSAMLWVVSALVAGLGLPFLKCGPHDGSNPVGGGPATMTMPGTFRATADSIYVSITTPSDTSSYCMQDSLVTRIDTGGVQDESGIPYSLSGNSLTLYSSPVFGDSTGYDVIDTMILIRMGSGAGLQGVWNLSSYGYKVLSGILPDSVRHEMDSTIADMNQKIRSGEMSAQLTFSGNQFTEVFSSQYSYDWAGTYIHYWTSCNGSTYNPDTCTYAVSAVKVNSTTVQLQGKKTNETVTITWNTANDQVYTSSDTSHHAFTYYTNPTTCPNPAAPDWFSSFLVANIKSSTAMPKQAQIPLVRKNNVRSILKKFFLK